MPFKDKEKEREYRRKKYSDNLEKERERNRINHLKNKDRDSNKWKEWYSKNKEVRKEKQKKYFADNRDVIISKSRKKATEQRNQLDDIYVKHVIIEQTGLSIKTVNENKDLINSFRSQIKLNRLIKTKNGKSKKTK